MSGDGNRENEPKTSSEGEYKVGFRRPPKEHQFKPNQTGNPKGRPRGSKNQKTILNRELGRRVTVKIDGRRVKLTAREIMIRQIVEKAMKGDLRAVEFVFKNDPTAQEELSAAVRDEAASLADEDAATVRAFLVSRPHSEGRGRRQ